MPIFYTILIIIITLFADYGIFLSPVSLYMYHLFI